MTEVPAALRIRASSAGTTPLLSHVNVTFAHDSVANRALRQMFDNPLVNGANEQAAEPSGAPNTSRDEHYAPDLARGTADEKASIALSYRQATSLTSSLQQTEKIVYMKFLLVTYPDSESGHPTKYVRDSIPEIKSYPGGVTTPTPEAISFKPGELLGDETGAFGIKSWLESLGHQVVVTTDKEGPNCVFEKELVDADVVLSQPFYPAYMTAQRFAIAKKLKLCVTVGIGSDHYDLDAANEHKVTVAEVSYSNSRSVAEHVVMTALILVRNFVASHEVAKSGGWNIADCAARSYDLEGMHFGTIAAGRIGLDVLRKLKPFDLHLHYYDKHRLKPEVEEELGLIYHASVDEMLPLLDVLNISCPLHPETQGMVTSKFIAKCKRGVFIVNTARGGLCDENAVAEACKTGQIGGYGGDVWYPQPAPKDHPWRTMPYNAMVPHISGTSLSAQARYCAGTREILEAFLKGKPYRTEYLIAHKGKLAGAGAYAYTTHK